MGPRLWAATQSKKASTPQVGFTIEQVFPSSYAWVPSVAPLVGAILAFGLFLGLKYIVDNRIYQRNTVLPYNKQKSYPADNQMN